METWVQECWQMDRRSVQRGAQTLQPEETAVWAHCAHLGWLRPVAPTPVGTGACVSPTSLRGHPPPAGCRVGSGALLSQVPGLPVLPPGVMDPQHAEGALSHAVLAAAPRKH